MQILNSFSGPAYLPWQRMGNLDGWFGPLPQVCKKMSCHDSEFHRFSISSSTANIAERKIIWNDSSSSGICRYINVLYNHPKGHVPPAIQRLYPQVNLTVLSEWNDFNGTHFLDPTEDLFHTIGNLFIQLQTCSVEHLRFI